MCIPGCRKLSRNFHSPSLSLHRLPQPPDGFSWCFSASALGFRIFFLPIQASCPLVCPAVLWGLILEPRTFHLWFRQCFLSTLCSGGFGHLWNSQYFTRLHHLLFPPYMDTLIMVRLWLDQYFSSWNCVQAWEWDLVWHPSNWALATSHYQRSILRCTMLFPTQLCLVNLQLSFSVFFLWWQCLRCDKCWSEKNQSSYLFVTRIPRHPSFKR